MRIMDIASILALEAVIPALAADNKKQVLLELAETLADKIDLHERDIFDTVWEREQLGTTAIGGGIAIPHARIPKLGRIYGGFARLETPLDFGAADGQPVDLVFMMLSPENAAGDHLQALKAISQVLRDEAVVAKLRQLKTAKALYNLLLEKPASAVA